MARRRIGIMGGSFNPIHRRHLQIAECALKEINLDRILFIPNGNPPHKNYELIDAKHRFEMTRLAVIPYEKFTVSDIELTREGIIYTTDTLKHLHQQYPDSDLFFIIGEDSLFELESWMRPHEIFAQCSFVVCMRHQHNVSDHPYVQKLRSQGAVFYFLTLSPLNINASDIRRQISHGEFSETLLTPEVSEYIRVMSLYGYTASPSGANQVYDKLKEDLSEDRLLHSMAAAYTANRLARIYQLKVKECELAALLHDCAKCMNLRKQQQLARDAKLQLSDIEYSSVGLLHGPVSAVIAESKYGIHDIDILTAIATHTTGYAGMTEFDMVVFLADKIEPYRDNSQALEEIRVLADQDLFKATYAMLRNSLEHVTYLNKTLHPETNKTIQWVLDHTN